MGLGSTSEDVNLSLLAASRLRYGKITRIRPPTATGTVATLTPERAKTTTRIYSSQLKLRKTLLTKEPKPKQAR